MSCNTVKWHTQATLSWLQTVLYERFGHVFDLQLEPSGDNLKLQLPTNDCYITLVLDGYTFTRADSNLPCTVWNAINENWRPALPNNLPAPGASQLPSPLITAHESGFHIGYDILGLTYWMLTRQEEVGRTDLDNHQRFPAVNSHAYKHEYLERPIVDEWLHILGQVIQRTWPNIKLKEHKFSMKVSHDVDRPSRYGFTTVKGLVRAMAGDVLKRGDIKSAVLAPWIRLNTRNTLHPLDPFNTFNWLMDLSEQHNLTSAFYFICGHTSSMDADYEPEHPAIRSLIREIHRRGHEIGLHPSYGTYQKPQLIAHEADRLRSILAEENIQQDAIGGRMHYLRWEHPTTMNAWADAGMAYDSTLSYADRPGFRCGTCYEYPAFDPGSQESFNLRIRPLTVMECSITAPQYLNFGTGDNAKEKFALFKNNCRLVNGDFTLLWHNSEFTEKSMIELYKDIIRA